MRLCPGQREASSVKRGHSSSSLSQPAKLSEAGFMIIVKLPSGSEHTGVLSIPKVPGSAAKCVNSGLHTEYSNEKSHLGYGL